MHILVVDDQEQERYLLKLLLESAGHQVSQAADGQAALEQARTNKPQVIISDLLMPRLDGYALLYTMRHDPILQDVPLVFYTATFTDEDDRQLALNLGASRFLVKPDALNIITDEVQAVVAEQATDGLPKLELSEGEFYRRYSGRLLSKIEDKLEQTQRANVLLREQSEEIRRQALENSRLLQEVQTALAARESFMNIASHELKTPMTLIKGWSQIIEREIGKGLDSPELKPERLTNGVQRLVLQINRAELLVNNIADAAEFQAGTFVPALQPKPLVPLLRALLSNHTHLTSQHHITLDLPPDTEELQVALEPERLDRALANLLDNAVKFSPAGSEVQLIMRVDPIARQVRLAVSDNGTGISPESRARIFDQFYQAEGDYRQRNYGGMGLGLYVSRAIIEAHNGQLELAETGSNGTTFNVKLPVLTS
jgi:signal transduction histidine kinase